MKLRRWIRSEDYNGGAGVWTTSYVSIRSNHGSCGGQVAKVELRHGVRGGVKSGSSLGRGLCQMCACVRSLRMHMCVRCRRIG